MKERLLYYFTGLSVFLLIPYLMTCIMNGAETALINRNFDVEKFMPFVLSVQIGDDYEEEALKAQAVIARTNFYYEMEKKDFFEIVNDLQENNRVRKYDFVDKIINYNSYPQKKYFDAVLDTKRMVLTYKNEIKMIPYHLCSCGKTRDGEEVFYSSEYSYLKSVESGFDKEFSDYINVTYFSKEQLSDNVKIQEKDQAGYVLSLNIDGKILEGETFRQGMNLPSSNFKIKKTGEKYQIISRGVGHGVGFSQYGGNRLAENEKEWREILEIYFPEMNISEI